MDDRVLLMTAARIILLSRHGTLTEQMERLEGSSRGDGVPAASAPAENAGAGPNPRRTARGCSFLTASAGFPRTGASMSRRLAPGQWTPAPWINVIANPAFGFQVSESGAGYTWAGNSRENQLTPWSNDPVSGSAGRGGVYPRRGHRRSLDADGAPDPRRRFHLHVPARARVQPVRGRRARDTRGADAIRRAGRPRQDFPAASD